MAQNEMKAKPALLERVRSMEGLGSTLAARLRGCTTETLRDEGENQGIQRHAFGSRTSCQLSVDGLGHSSHELA